MKTLALSAALIFFAFVMNFGIYLFSYNRIIFSYLTESQRMDIAPVIFSQVLLGYFVSSIVVVMLTIYLKKYITKSSS